MRTGTKGVEQFANLTEHMCQRKHGHQTLSRIDRQDLHTDLDVVAERFAVEHHALGATGRTAGVVDERHFLGIGREIDILRLDAMRIFGAEEFIDLFFGRHLLIFGFVERAPIDQRQGCFEFGGHLLMLQFFPYIRTDKEQFAVRMLQQMGDIFGREVL